MSNADPGEIVTASSDGVSVEKSFEPDDFPVPAIAFVVRSERDETVSVRLVDSVPDHVPPEDIGFHPKYGAEFWGVEGEEIVFEREFEPGEEYTTVYGLRGGDAEDAEEFMSEPRLESVDPPLTEADAGGTVRDVIGEADAGAEESDPGDEEDEIASAVEAVDPGSSGEGPADGAETDDSEAAPADDLGGPADEPGDLVGAIDEGSSDEDPIPDLDAGEAAGPSVDPDDGSLVSALAAEIRSGNVDDEAVEDLRDALGVDPASASVEARIEHLQSSISDLDAYTDALEEFLDENGDAQRIIRETREEFEAATERLDEIETTADEAVETAEAVDDRLEAKFEEFESRVDGELAEVESRVDDALAEVDEAVGGLDAAVDERVEAELDELWTAIDEAAAEAADVADGLAELREEVEADAGERIDELEDDLEEISSELDSLAEMRDRLASALGGLAPQPDPDVGNAAESGGPSDESSGADGASDGADE